MHPLLLPGTHLVRRGPDQLQAGLTRRHAVALPASAARVEELYTNPAVRRALARKELLLDDDRPLRTALPALGDGDPWVRHTLAATVRRRPRHYEESLASRAGHVVEVRTFGHPLARTVAADLEQLCRRAGLRLRGSERPGPAPRGAVRPRPLAVLVGVGEPSRDLLDDWLRNEVPHLVVRVVEGNAIVGPFVAPGRTACLRCTDAYLTEDDPAWPLLVEQYARATRTDRADGVPEPVDAALAAVAVGWAVRDLQSHAEGGRPTTWSATVTLPAGLGAVEPQRWSPHPHCGCGWA